MKGGSTTTDAQHELFKLNSAANKTQTDLWIRISVAGAVHKAARIVAKLDFIRRLVQENRSLQV